MKTIQKRLDQIVSKITSPSFIENKGLGNEIGYHIFDYHPKHEMLVRDRVASIIKRINHDATLDINIIEFDLYEVVLYIMEEKGYLHKNFTLEQKRGSQYVLNATRKALRLTLENDLVIKYIKEHSEGYNMIFITGVGKVFPIIRSHVILNNLHRAIQSKPVILFYPGRYNGQDLLLFGEIKDDNYYRAFQLVEHNDYYRRG